MRKREKKGKRRPHSITGNKVGEVACGARSVGCVFASTCTVYPVVGKMAAGCAGLFITISPCAIDFAQAPVSVYYLNVKMSVLVIAGSIKRRAARSQPQTCREPRQADELLRRG